MIGLVSLLLALVLGLLVFTAFSVFTSQQSEAYSLGPVVADIDLALERYGPEGGPVDVQGSAQRWSGRASDSLATPSTGRGHTPSRR